MKRGYIRIYRKIRDNFVWEIPASRTQAWLDLLMMANHKDTKFLFNNKLVNAKRGDVITSETKLSLRWQWSRSKVSRFLKMLESEQMITRKPNAKPNKKGVKKSNIITICNYDVYQDVRTTNDTTLDTTLEHKEDTKEGINEKHYIYSDLDFDFEGFVKYYNSINPPTRIKKLTEGRKQKITALLTKHEYTKDNFLDVTHRLKTMDKETAYLYGGGKNGFRMDVDWLLQPDNFQKVLEGVYGGGDRQLKIEADKRREEKKRREEAMQKERERQAREQQEQNNEHGEF